MQLVIADNRQEHSNEQGSLVIWGTTVKRQSDWSGAEPFTGPISYACIGKTVPRRSGSRADNDISGPVETSFPRTRIPRFIEQRPCASPNLRAFSGHSKNTRSARIASPGSSNRRSVDKFWNGVSVISLYARAPRASGHLSRTSVSHFLRSRRSGVERLNPDRSPSSGRICAG
jgi:hypothetical protein